MGAQPEAHPDLRGTQEQVTWINRDRPAIAEPEAVAEPGLTSLGRARVRWIAIGVREMSGA